MATHIFVTGGEVSGLGKGITAASLGRLLKARGFKVASQKLDPYMNVDPGTMSPLQHGEVFVTNDGAETDLDLGHYERFIDEVIKSFENGGDFSYRVFSCSKMDYDGERRIDSSLPTIVEGSYALHPSFPSYGEKAFFLDVDKEEQLKRLEKRCPEKLEDFKNKWIPLEEAYFSSFSIPSKADEIL